MMKNSEPRSGKYLPYLYAHCQLFNSRNNASKERINRNLQQIKSMRHFTITMSG